DSGDHLVRVITENDHGVDNGLWEMGESLCYDCVIEDLDSWRLRTIVIDSVSNSVVMSGTITDGRFIQCMSTDDTIREEGGR
ncbi:MAG: hypothetical protein ACP5FL_07870, partial [Thermoplasmatota archaeon]